MNELRPSKIVCVGRNYAAHAAELGNPMPERPMLFLKPPSALLGHGEAIRLPAASQRVEYEGEIGVVMGQRFQGGSLEDAERAIGGFTCVNDVTARDLQRVDGQWGRAKGFDTFCPAGPRVARGLDWRTLELATRVNGAERQRASSAGMHFSIPELVVYIGGIMTLEPGDLIATGTPAGVGPLSPGDVVEIEISGIGVLSNIVQSGAEQ
ncbi:MAG TPA: fumarylacetoacetate hydrolase family protein [Gemmatimonadales bacterium]|jgi:2-keto-4-pentenoate hydratase/2-oxohepta-3-ene-1,7-dioic acid hydratase in catechol pathway|nr:fumarylacetoacetate hydrolase family protein [Gemmatimonadales bacterium]